MGSVVDLGNTLGIFDTRSCSNFLILTDITTGCNNFQHSASINGENRLVSRQILCSTIRRELRAEDLPRKQSFKSLDPDSESEQLIIP